MEIYNGENINITIVSDGNKDVVISPRSSKNVNIDWEIHAPFGSDKFYIQEEGDWYAKLEQCLSGTDIELPLAELYASQEGMLGVLLRSHGFLQTVKLLQMAYHLHSRDSNLSGKKLLDIAQAWVYAHAMPEEAGRWVSAGYSLPKDILRS